MKIPPSATRAPYLLWAALVIALWRVAASAGAADDAGAPPHTLACPTVTAYVRAGCPHCTAAKAWLAANPTAWEPWLDGVTTKDGGDAKAAVTAALQ